MGPYPDFTGISEKLHSVVARGCLNYIHLLDALTFRPQLAWHETNSVACAITIVVFACRKRVPCYSS